MTAALRIPFVIAKHRLRYPQVHKQLRGVRSPWLFLNFLILMQLRRAVVDSGCDVNTLALVALYSTPIVFRMLVLTFVLVLLYFGRSGTTSFFKNPVTFTNSFP